MRLSDLMDARIRTVDGKKLGRVHDVHAEGGRVVALACGAGGFIERLTAKKHGRRIPWDCVRKVTHKEVVVALDSPQAQPKKASGSRTPQRTRRPSAPRSKR